MTSFFPGILMTLLSRASFGLAEKAPPSGCNTTFPELSKSIQSRSIGLFMKTLTTPASYPRAGGSCIAMGTTGKKCIPLRVVRCRQISDLDPESLGPVRIKAKPRGFRVTRIAVDVLGICAECAGKVVSK